MWIVLVWLCIFGKGLSLSNNCSDTRNVSLFPGESFTLDLDEDGVEENSLVDGSGTDIARINKSGELTVLDEHYKDKLSAKGFSFHIQNASIKDQKQFTASVVYSNGIHCSQHYLVKELGDRICSERINIEYIPPNHSFTLAFDSAGVEEITWVDNSNKAIAVTKATLILDRDYKGNLNPISVTLHKPNATTIAQEIYTARVSFRNGTRCLQHYLVDIPCFQWYKWLITDFNTTTVCLLIFMSAVFSAFFCKKIYDWFKERKKSEEKKI